MVDVRDNDGRFRRPSGDHRPDGAGEGAESSAVVADRSVAAGIGLDDLDCVPELVAARMLSATRCASS